MAFRSSKNRRRADGSRVRASGPGLSRVAMAAGLTLVVALAARAGYGWAHRAPTFALKRITFEGAVRATPAELLKLSGLATGQNLFELDSQGVARAMSSHPWVREATLVRHLPSSLVVHVEEHVPAAMVALGDLYLVDAEGEPFKKVQSHDAVELPLVTGVDRDGYVARPRETQARLKGALERVAEYARLNDGVALSEVRLEDVGVTLVTAAGQELVLGEGAADVKLARLSKVRAELVRRGLTAESIYLDNRTRPGWVTVKLSSAPPERGTAAVQ